MMRYWCHVIIVQTLVLWSVMMTIRLKAACSNPCISPIFWLWEWGLLMMSWDDPTHDVMSWVHSWPHLMTSWVGSSHDVMSWVVSWRCEIRSWVDLLMTYFWHHQYHASFGLIYTTSWSEHLLGSMVQQVPCGTGGHGFNSHGWLPHLM